VTNLTFSSTIVKDKHKALIGTEGKACISIQPESINVIATTISSYSTVSKDVGLDVREEMVNVIKASIMEK
jgi:hypothetical protein